MKTIFTRAQVNEFESRYRGTLINSLAGVKQVVLVGTANEKGQSNLAIFNSLLHLGAHPPLYGLLFRPQTVRRHTLENILSTSHYTLNYLNFGYHEQAHQTSAKYQETESEFTATGLHEEFSGNNPAPYVREADIQIGMKYIEQHEISLNATTLLIGEITEIRIRSERLNPDGFADLSGLLTCGGLDAYYMSEKKIRHPYARPDKKIE